eukprot:7462238-Ditylum_brightwellii.AAC.1
MGRRNHQRHWWTATIGAALHYIMKHYVLQFRVLGNVLKLLHPVPLSSISSGDQCLKLSIEVSPWIVETKSNEPKWLLDDTIGDI